MLCVYDHAGHCLITMNINRIQCQVKMTIWITGLDAGAQTVHLSPMLEPPIRI
jgi:hypothetical protein